SVHVSMTFNLELRDAHTTEQARAAALLGSITAPAALGVAPDIMNHTSALMDEQLSRLEVISYDGHRLRVLVHDTVNGLRSRESVPTLPVACGIGDSLVSGVCVARPCVWADATHGGSGTPARLVYDITVDLHW
ncbi:MAG: hypothetical protein JWN04_3760, partial [Myxococcaceae bacterium]|nr:hypothetical protein [Myxococcaceae bacterium]